MTELSEKQKAALEQARKEHDIKFKTWAIDRVMQMMSLPRCGVRIDADNILSEANKLCGWVGESPKYWPIPTEDEADAALSCVERKGQMPEA